MIDQALYRRQFLQQTGATALCGATLIGSSAGVTRAVAASCAPAEDTPSMNRSPNESIVVGIMGLNGRGGALADSFMAQPNVKIGGLCDVDQRVLARTASSVTNKQGTAPSTYTDVRKMLEDSAIDALVVAAPNHWHAPATILGCQAGKHVYVEKPCSYTPREGELAVAAARKHKRVVCMGNQRRSFASFIDAIDKLRQGVIGPIHYVRTWYNARRPSVGTGNVVAPPAELNFELWQGPAPDRPYLDNLLHYNWHWYWHWGNGELGNNGIHSLDVARWALGLDYPRQVTATGGRYGFRDDQETPDTMMVSYDFGSATITWEGLSCSAYGPGGSGYGLSFHGAEGTLVLQDSGYKILDGSNKEVATAAGSGGLGDHLANFLACVRSGDRPNSDIEEAHKSTLLCHLGNIAYRLGRALKIDPRNGNIVGDEQATGLWSREYRKGWEPTV
ncbi:MAG: Gfo/Idh/MocA family oxidoreductase [Planctomycetes bacterium]|nr:Gfo/Idh/MocA family oxidoreductase [Planctomycetota bacterium]